MSWLQKLLPPKIKRARGRRKSIPEGLWSKCPACEAVLYRSDLEKQPQRLPEVRPSSSPARPRRARLLLDAEGRFEIGAEVLPVDPLKFKDSKRYPDRLNAAHADTGEADALVVMQGAIKTVPVVVACLRVRLPRRLDGLGGRRALRARRAVGRRAALPFICITASGGARMQEGLLSLMQMAKTTPRR
jgi:acetyl-CoA carboxylase carboxyl transferase subunit beta